MVRTESGPALVGMQSAFTSPHINPRKMLSSITEKQMICARTYWVIFTYRLVQSIFNKQECLNIDLKGHYPVWQLYVLADLIIVITEYACYVYFVQLSYIIMDLFITYPDPQNMDRPPICVISVEKIDLFLLLQPTICIFMNFREVGITWNFNPVLFVICSWGAGSLPKLNT